MLRGGGGGGGGVQIHCRRLALLAIRVVSFLRFSTDPKRIYFLFVYHRQSPNADHKVIRSYLLRTKKDWIIPERRVAKFLKRQKAGRPIADNEEESVMTGGPVRRFLSGTSSNKSSKTRKQKSAKQSGVSSNNTVATSKTAETPAPQQKEEVPAPEPEPVVTKEIEIEPPTVEETKEEEVQRDIIPPEAVDDNDGKKDCLVCTGCVIL